MTRKGPRKPQESMSFSSFSTCSWVLRLLSELGCLHTLWSGLQWSCSWSSSWQQSSVETGSTCTLLVVSMSMCEPKSSSSLRCGCTSRSFSSGPTSQALPSSWWCGKSITDLHWRWWVRRWTRIAMETPSTFTTFRSTCLTPLGLQVSSAWSFLAPIWVSRTKIQTWTPWTNSQDVFAVSRPYSCCLAISWREFQMWSQTGISKSCLFSATFSCISHKAAFLAISFWSS